MKSTIPLSALKTRKLFGYSDMNTYKVIRFILMYASMGLSLSAIILLLYGAYLFDLKLVTKFDIFVTVSIPIFAAIFCLWRACK